MTHPDHRSGRLRATDFDLAWRWTRLTHAVLPDDVLAEIEPIDRDAADAWAHEAHRRFQGVSGLSFRAPSEAAESTRIRLQALPVTGETFVVVCWSTGLAVRTRWRIFVQYWSAFCYPASDDVVVWTPEHDWALCYHHDEVFEWQASGTDAA